MALSNAGVVEVRTGGSDNNGGGFKTGATGTDFSQQNAAQFALTNVTTSAANAVLLSASAATTMVGNYANIVSGTNFTAGIYEIISVVAGVSITLDRNCTTAAGSLGVVNIGGALLTIGKALGILTVTGMQCWVAAGTYSISTGLSTSAGGGTSASIIRVAGYNTARGDLAFPSTLTRPVIQVSAAVTGLTDANGGFRFENLTFDGNSKVATGLDITGSYTSIINCIIKNWAPTSNATIHFGGEGNVLLACEVTANGGTVAVCYGNNTDAWFINNYIHANTASSTAVIFLNGHGVHVEENIIASNSGTNTDAILVNFILGTVRHNSIYNNARDGIRNAAGYGFEGEISNNIFVSNGGWGINLSVMSPVRNDALIHHNAYYNNTSGAQNGVNAGTGDVTLTGVPFNNAAGNDFSLNNTANQGAPCRKAGYPGVMIAGGTGYKDLGALQTPAPNLVHPGMCGGMRG